MTRRPTEPLTCQNCNGYRNESCVACQMAVCPKCDERKGGYFICVPCRGDRPAMGLALMLMCMVTYWVFILWLWGGQA